MDIDAQSHTDAPIIGGPRSHAEGTCTFRDYIAYGAYALGLVVSISLWFRAIYAPLRTDETGSYWLITGGLPGIWEKRFIGLAFPAYQYILWFSTKLIGTSEVALRVPSVLAMLGAAYFLFLATRELLGREIGVIATIIFCLNSTVVFASIDIRPYAFAVLVTNAAILVFFRLLRNDSYWLAGMLGFLSGLIVYFHYLIASILPAFLICFLILKHRNKGVFWRQTGVALAVFGITFLPLIPGLRYLFHTAGSHIVPTGEGPVSLIWTLVPFWLIPALALSAIVAFLLASAKQDSKQEIRVEGRQIFLCVSLALVPALILYWITFGMSIDVFSAPYHRLGAIPGIAMCWAIVASRFGSRVMRWLVCIVFVAFNAGYSLNSPASKQHAYSWKYALIATEKSASIDGAPVVICSNFIESNYSVMPIGDAKTSKLFAPLSYYKLTAPVVPLPEGFNQETVRVFSPFLKDAEQRHQRFLVVGHSYSYKTLDWIVQSSSDEYIAHCLGVFDGIKVLEFLPRSDIASHKKMDLPRNDP